MRISCIYKITNLIDDKVYIGQTTNYRKRKTTHFAHLRRNAHCNEHLQRAFNKYGEENFAIEIIKECGANDLDYWEIYFINKFKACDKRYGYNLIDGGQKYRHHTKEVRAKISKRLKGKPFTKEHKNNLAKANHLRVISQEQQDEMTRKMRETKLKMEIGCGEKNGNAIISDEKAQELLLEALQLQEVIVKDLAQKYSVSEQIVYNLIENKSYKNIIPEFREQIKNKKKNYNRQKQQQALELLKQGYSQNQIAHTLKISRNTIRKLISY